MNTQSVAIRQCVFDTGRHFYATVVRLDGGVYEVDKDVCPVETRDTKTCSVLYVGITTKLGVRSSFFYKESGVWRRACGTVGTFMEAETTWRGPSWSLSLRYVLPLVLPRVLWLEMGNWLLVEGGCVVQ